MTLCISLSARPSNNGTRFHNHLYEQLGLNWIYKAFAPTDLAQAIAGVRGLGIRGCAVSMPYKEDVIALVDVMDPSAKAIDSVNTIVNDGGHLTAYNTDYTAIEQLLRNNAVPDGLLGVAPRAPAAWPRPLRRHCATPASATSRSSPATRRPAGRSRNFTASSGWAGGPGRRRQRYRARAHQRDPHRYGRRPGRRRAVLPAGSQSQAAKVVFDVVALPAETPLDQGRRAPPARP